MEIIFSVVILAAVVLALTNEVFQQKTGVSPMPTVSSVRREMVGLIPAGTTGTILELGSGWGGIAFAAARAYPQAQVVGVEYSPFPFLAARLRKLLSPGLSNLRLVRQDFFDVSFRDASVVLCYLCNPLMARLERKFTQELPPGATVISSTFFIPGWEPERVKDLTGFWKTRIFVYRKKGKEAACPN